MLDNSVPTGLLTGAQGGVPGEGSARQTPRHSMYCTNQKANSRHSRVMYTPKGPQQGVHPVSDRGKGMATPTQALATSDHQEDCSFMLS